MYTDDLRRAKREVGRDAGREGIQRSDLRSGSSNLLASSARIASMSNRNSRPPAPDGQHAGAGARRCRRRGGSVQCRRSRGRPAGASTVPDHRSGRSARRISLSSCPGMKVSVGNAPDAADVTRTLRSWQPPRPHHRPEPALCPSTGAVAQVPDPDQGRLAGLGRLPEREGRSLLPRRGWRRRSQDRPYPDLRRKAGFVAEYAYSFGMTVCPPRRYGAGAVSTRCRRKPPGYSSGWSLLLFRALGEQSSSSISTTSCPKVYESRFASFLLPYSGLRFLERSTYAAVADHVILRRSPTGARRSYEVELDEEVTIVRTGPDADRLRAKPGAGAATGAVTVPVRAPW